MREITTGFDVTGLDKVYPKVSKVTVDDDNQTAYVFTGRSNRAATITGEEYDALVGMLPPAVESGQGNKTEGKQPDDVGKTAETETETEPNASTEAKTAAKGGKKEK